MPGREISLMVGRRSDSVGVFGTYFVLSIESILKSVHPETLEFLESFGSLQYTASSNDCEFKKGRLK